MAGIEIKVGLCLLIVGCMLSTGFALKPMCSSDTRTYHGPKFPKLPANFSSLVEYTLGRNGTHIVTQELKMYYDQNGDKGAIEHMQHGEISRNISDFTTDEFIMANGVTKSCKVMKLEKVKKNVFHFSKPGGHHISTISQLFKFSKDYNQTYRNISYVRGIKCHHWRTCVNRKNASFNIDSYFSVLKSKDGNTVPVMITAMGVSQEGTKLPHDFMSVYNFFSFRPGVPKAEHFQTPPGIFCNVKRKKKIPTLHTEFEMAGEMVRTKNADTRNFREYYDLKEGYYRLDHLSYKTNVPERTILDFHTGLRYRIERDTFKCKIEPINRTYFGTTNDPEHLLRLRTPSELFHLGNNGSKYTYVGLGNVRSIGTEIWISSDNSTSRGVAKLRTYEWHFSRPNWKILSNISPTAQRQVPLLLRVYHGKRSENVTIINFFDFDPSEPSMHMLWPLRVCFWENRHYMYFRLDGKFGTYAYGNERAVQKGIQKAVSKAGKISSLRVSSILIFNSSYSNVIAVRLYVLGVPKVKGTPVLSPRHTIPLTRAVDYIKKTITRGKLQVTFPYKGTMKTLEVQKNSYYESDSTEIIEQYTEKEGFSVGHVVGVSIGVIFLAVLITLLAIYVLMKRKGQNLFTYLRFK